MIKAKFSCSVGAADCVKFNSSGDAHVPFVRTPNKWNKWTFRTPFKVAMLN